MKCLIRKQRNEIYTILFTDDGSMPDDDSLDPRYRNGVRILGMAGPMGVGLLIGADLEFLDSLGVGETIGIELTATPQYSIKQWWNLIKKGVRKDDGEDFCRDESHG